MDGTSGLELAKWLYGLGVCESVIFITGSAEYALAGHSAHPLHHLLKPVSRADLETVLHLALEARQSQALVSRQLNGETQCPLTLNDAERLVPAGMFSRCHKSYLVNLAMVKAVSRSELHMLDGETLPVSRTVYRPFQSALVRHLNRAGI